MAPPDPAEVDRRFQELMRAEFVDDTEFVADSGPTEPAPDEQRRRTFGRVLPFHAGKVTSDQPDDYPTEYFDDESYRDVDDDKNSWSGASVLGFVLLGGGLAGMMAMVFGVVLGSPWAQVALFATIAGLVVLMVQALRSTDSSDGSGATL